MNGHPPNTNEKKPCRKPTDNERGSVLLVSLLVVMSLSLFAVMALKTTGLKLALSGNDKTITQLKTRAESTVAAAAEHVELLPRSTLKDSDWESPTRLAWFSRGEDNAFDMLSGKNKSDDLNDYIINLSNWTLPDDGTPNCTRLVPETDFDAGEGFEDRFPDCRFQVIDVEVSEGSSLQIGNDYSTMHNMYITTSSTKHKAKRMVQIGYRKRY